MDRPALAIVHAAIPPGEHRSVKHRHPVSPATQKLVLLVLAAHEGKRVTQRDVAALAGLSECQVAHATRILLESRLVERVEIDRGSPGVSGAPVTGPVFTYRVCWKAITALPRVRFVPKSEQKHLRSAQRRKAVTA